MTESGSKLGWKKLHALLSVILILWFAFPIHPKDLRENYENFVGIRDRKRDRTF